jgi:maltose O-acetyltransferase
MTAILRFASLPIPRTLRWALLRWCGLNVQTRAIDAGTRFFGPGVTIGRGTYVNTRCHFDSWGPVTIGADCAIGPGVMFITSSHRLGGHARRALEIESGPIVVGDGCWIGAGAIILPGVTIRDGTVIAAGAVVTGDCKPDRLYGGVPARELRAFDDTAAPPHAG